MSGRRFVALLLCVSALGLGVRVAYVLVAKAHDPLRGDQIYYSIMADTLASGQGFRDPFIHDRVVPSADHPPLTAIVAAPASWVTSTTGDRILAQRLIMAGVGAAAVAAIGLAGREIAGSRRGAEVGLVAAGIAAIHPSLWINDGLIMSESLGALTVALVVLAAARAWDRRSPASLAWLGASVGLAALARAEAILLAVVLIVPIALSRRGPSGERSDWRLMLRRLGAGAAGVVVLLAPWVVPNMVRFNRFTTLSTNDGLTLIGTNCDAAWRGSSAGLWVLSCIGAVDSDGDGVDDWREYLDGSARLAAGQDYSDVSARYRSAALDYLKGHLGELPRVVLIREGRLWGVTDVRGMIYYNTGEGREEWASWAAIAAYWALLAPAAAGLVVLRRRGRPVWPLAAQLAAAAITAAAFYGLWRFRIGADVAIIIAAAVVIEAGLTRVTSAATSRTTARLAP